MSDVNKYYSSIDTINLDNPDSASELKEYIENLKKKWDFLTEEEGITLLKYYTKLGLKMLGVKRDIKIEIMEDEIMRKKYGYISGNGKKTHAMAVAKPEKGTIVYSMKLVRNLISTDKNVAFRAARIAFHETKHIEQIYAKEESFNNYERNIEYLAYKIAPDFYYNNYNISSREIDAEKFGLTQAVNCFPALGVNYTKLKNIRKEIEDETSKQEFFIVGRMFTNDGGIFRRGKRLPLADKTRMYEMAAAQIIKKEPTEVFRKYKILRYGFNAKTGERKSDTEILEEMKYVYLGSERLCDKLSTIEELAKIMMNRYSDDYVADIALIEQYRQILKGSGNILDGIIEAKRELNSRGMTREKADKILKNHGIGLSMYAKLKKIHLKLQYFTEVKLLKRKLQYMQLPPAKEPKYENEMYSQSKTETIDTPMRYSGRTGLHILSPEQCRYYIPSTEDNDESIEETSSNKNNQSDDIENR